MLFVNNLFKMFHYKSIGKLFENLILYIWTLLLASFNRKLCNGLWKHGVSKSTINSTVRLYLKT